MGVATVLRLPPRTLDMSKRVDLGLRVYACFGQGLENLGYGDLHNCVVYAVALQPLVINGNNELGLCEVAAEIETSCGATGYDFLPEHQELRIAQCRVRFNFHL